MKKTLAILMAAAMLTGLTGCQSSGGSASTTAAAETTTAAANAGTEAGKASEAPAENSGGVVADINGDGKTTIACVHRNLLGASGVNFRASYYYSAAQMENVELLFFDGNQDVTKQCNYIEDCMASKAADAFIVWTCDPDGIAGTVQAAHDAGYPIIVIDISLQCDQEAFVAAGNEEMGVMTGESAVEYLTKKNGSPSGTVYVITASNQSTARDRVAGFLSVIEKYPDIKVVDTYDMPTSSVDDGVALADDLIQKNPEGTIDLYFCMNMSPMLGLISSAATANRTDFVVVGGFDYNDTFVEELQKGEGNTILWSFAAQDCFKIGSQAFELAVDAAQGKLPEQKEFSVPGDLVTVDNLDEYLKNYNFYQEQILQYQ
ncbi:MAG: sugar ABC transporter substrate-binding protein [Lachnospiraceae bacterium]|nr:sugar ABC transporter substrate-binding protein [Lachnospiraceae bacterium]